MSYIAKANNNTLDENNDEGDSALSIVQSTFVVRLISLKALPNRDPK